MWKLDPLSLGPRRVYDSEQTRVGPCLIKTQVICSSFRVLFHKKTHGRWVDDSGCSAAKTS
jgi:hypothetical protein